MSAQQDRDVASLFANMTEIEIISLRLGLTESGNDGVSVLNPVNSKQVFITMEDLNRRDEQHRNGLPSERISAPSNFYNEIEDYYDQATPAQVAQIRQQAVEAPPVVQTVTDVVRLPTRASVAPTNLFRRRYLIIASLVGLILLFIVAAVVVAVVLLGGSDSNSDNDAISGGSDETNCTSPPPPPPAVQRCILLIGGFELGSVPLIEYYHPTMDECNTDAIGTMSTLGLDKTKATSGCYLSDTQQIVIREGLKPDKPPMIYGLNNASAKHLPLPLNAYTYSSTTASISPTKCLSCGGTDKKSGFKQCYQFDSASPTEWTEIPSLPRQTYFAAAVSMASENSHYVIGGAGNNNSNFKQLLRYAVDERQWYSEPSMVNVHYSHSGAALSATELLVCGGGNNDRACEVYNTMRRRWRPVGNLIFGRSAFDMVTFNDIVYAIGGIDYNDNVLDSVEAYDERTETWALAKKLKHKRYSFVSVVV